VTLVNLMMTNQDKSKFNDLLGQAIECENEWLDRKLNGHLCYGKGGGGPSQTTSNVTQTNLPEYLEPYIINLANRAEAESNRAYTPYSGQRISDLGADTQIANQAVRNVFGAGQPGTFEAMGATRDNLGFLESQRTGAGAQPFQFGRFGGFEGYNYRDPTQFSEFQFQDVQKFTDPNVVSDYMSPYMQNVVDRQKDAARRDFQRSQSTRDAQAIRQSGGLESGRKFLQDMRAEEDLQDTLGDIQAQGQQQAFEQAATMFGQDRSVMMEQEGRRLGELAERERAQASEFARAGDQAAAERARIQASQYEDAARVQANQAQEDRAAATFGITAAEASGAQAAQLAKLQEMARAGDMQAIEALASVGKQMDLREQAAQDLAYEDFLRQQGYGRDQLGFLSGILRGMPSQMGLTEQRLLQVNPLQQALGAGIGGVSLYKALQGQ